MRRLSEVPALWGGDPDARSARSSEGECEAEWDDGPGYGDDRSTEPSGEAALHGVFIRAPVIEEVGSAVQVLARLPLDDGTSTPVVCGQGPILATSFHPELTGDNRLHRLFVMMAGRFAESDPAVPVP